MKQQPLWMALLASSIILAACGGGGGSGSSMPPPPPATATPTPPPSGQEYIVMPLSNSTAAVYVHIFGNAAVAVAANPANLNGLSCFQVNGNSCPIQGQLVLASGAYLQPPASRTFSSGDLVASLTTANGNIPYSPQYQGRLRLPDGTFLAPVTAFRCVDSGWTPATCPAAFDPSQDNLSTGVVVL